MAFEAKITLSETSGAPMCHIRANRRVMRGTSFVTKDKNEALYYHTQAYFSVKMISGKAPWGETRRDRMKREQLEQERADARLAMKQELIEELRQQGLLLTSEKRVKGSAEEDEESSSEAELDEVQASVQGGGYAHVTKKHLSSLTQSELLAFAREHKTELGMKINKAFKTGTKAEMIAAIMKAQAKLKAGKAA